MKNKQKTLVLYGGSFKPVTAGHVSVVEESYKEIQNIDEFIIFVGEGERDNIDQTQSLLVWEIYKKHLPSNIKIEPCKAPIGDIIRFIKANPQDKIYWILGAREGKDEDQVDIKNRTERIKDKYPHLTIKVITTPDGGMSGTNARKTLKQDLKSLTPYLPNFLSNSELDEVWEILGQSDSQTINEGKQVGTLYHFTSKEGLKSILKSNSLKAHQEHYRGDEINFISFTRNKNFHKKSTNFNVKLDYRITLDGDKLSNNLKISPFAYIPGWDYKDNWEYEWLDDESEETVRNFLNGTGEYDEQEERVVFEDEEGQIKNIKKYILKIDKVSDLLNENATYSQHIDYKQQIKDLTKYMLQQGKNIQPLPKVKFIHNGQLNAQNFLGKTAYYDPNNMSIVLYTEGRHPKDIVRSFSHEMVHHTQNLENRLGNIQTTNTTEDDALLDLEKEAYLEGNIIFRNWTDSINQNKTPLNEDISPSEAYTDEGALQTLIDKKRGVGYFSSLVTPSFISTQDLKGLNYIKLKNHPHDGTIVYNKGFESEAKELESLINKYDGYLPACEPCNYEDESHYNAESLEVLRKDIYRIGQLLGYKDKEIMNSPNKSLKETNDLFGLKEYTVKFAQKLIKENNLEYQIYSDMDGVLVDFDAKFIDHSGGHHPRDYDEKHGRTAFWDLIDNKGGVEFWANIPWMKDGKKYWNYIKKYNPQLLTSPSINEISRIGKQKWVDQHMPGVKINFEYSKDKQKLAKPNRILIDDKKSIIDSWNAAGGIGILHINADSTINQLKQLGL